MKRSLKTLRMRGSRTYGRGRQAKTGAGGRGGTGNAGSFSHQIISRILKEKRAIRDRKVIPLRDLNQRRDVLVRKGYLKKKRNQKETYYKTTQKFSKKYKKILGTGELSFRLKVLPPVKVSVSAKSKIL